MKKWTTLSLCLAALLCLVLFATPKTNAATYGKLTYTVSGGEVTITDCNTNVTGSLTIPAAIEGYPVTTIGYSAFSNCKSLTSITIPDGVTSLDTCAFSGCTSLTSVTIPDSVTTIGVNVFLGCTNLQYNIYDNGKYLGNANNPYVYLKDTVSDTITQMTVHPNTKIIERHIFIGCYLLTGIWVDENNPNYCSDSFGVLYNKNRTTLIQAPGAICGSYSVPDSVTTIGSTAFRSCTNLTTVTIGDSVTVIGSSAFSGCTSLTSVTIPDSVTYIGGSAFSDCDLLTSINIPASVTSFGSSAFSGCDSLQDVYITDPSAWCKIRNDNLQDSPMYYMERLHILDDNGNEVTEIVLDDSVTEIPSYAFRGCTSLTSVTIPDGITTIGNKAFNNCSGLTELTLPDSITGVGNSAFSGCKSLTKVYYSGSQAQWQKITIESYNSRLTDATVHYDHIHDYSLLPAEMVAPTCTDSGYTIYTCTHGDTRQGDFVPALGHQEASIPVCDPTCTEKGVSEAGIRCQRCEEYILEPVWIDALGHSFTEYVPNNDGTKTATCTICGIVDTVADKSTWLIVSQPEAVTTDSGETVSFSVEASGEIVSYQWQYRKLYKWFDTTMTGYDTDTLTVTATGARNGYDYRCVVTYSDGTVRISEPAELTVNTNITVTGNPNDQTAALGTKGQFTAAAEGEGIEYQWQYCRPNSEKWIDTAMEGATKPTVLIETTVARDGYQYRCKLTDVTGKVIYTEAATLRVLSIRNHPKDQTVLTGKTATFTVQTNVTQGATFQWQYRRNATANWTNTTMTGYNTATLTVAATKARNGYQYRCVITGAKNGKVTSNAAVLSVSDPVSITAQPENVTAAASENAVFTVGAANVTAYRWQYSRNGTTWYDTTATGCKTATLTVQ